MSELPPPPPAAEPTMGDYAAAKAQAKALRPWYRKKRWWMILGAVVVLFAAVAAAGGGGDDDGTASGSNGDTVSQGFGSRDASGDITSVELEPPDAIGAVYVTVNVTNHSSKRSDYFIDVAVESPDGKTQHDTTSVVILNVEPDQAASDKGVFLADDLPADAVAKVKKVSRTASS